MKKFAAILLLSLISTSAFAILVCEEFDTGDAIIYIAPEVKVINRANHGYTGEMAMWIGREQFAPIEIKEANIKNREILLLTYISKDDKLKLELQYDDEIGSGILTQTDEEDRTFNCSYKDLGE